MSARTNNPMFGQVDDPREVELIQSLVEKTRQGKIPWIKQANAITASIPGGFQINFVLSAPISIMGPYISWQLLTVRDKNGSELVRVSNSVMLSVLAGGPGSTLVAAANDLFHLVNSGAGDDLDRAINTIKKL